MLALNGFFKRIYSKALILHANASDVMIAVHGERCRAYFDPYGEWPSGMGGR